MNEHKIYIPPSQPIGEQPELPSIEEPYCIRCGLNYNRQIVLMGNRNCIPNPRECLYCKKTFEDLGYFFCSKECKTRDLKEFKKMSKETEFTTKDGWKVKIDNEVLEKMSKEAKRERVEDINKCSTPADVGEYLEDNIFMDPRVRRVLEHALYKSEKPNITQHQLMLQSIGTIGRAYEVLLRIMEIRFSLDRLDL